MQARVVADGPAGLGGLAQVGRHAALDEVADLEQLAVDLVADLQGVAAVDEDRRLVLQDHCCAGRAGEARGPRQAVVGGRQVLVLVFVLVRGDEAVETLLSHGLADQGHVLGPEGTVGAFVEGLAHGRHVIGPRGWGQPQEKISILPGQN